MPFVYSVYHLNISSSCELPYLTPIEDNVDIDVFVSFWEDKPIFHPPSEPFRFWQISASRLGFYIFLSTGYAEYIIDKDDSSIRIAHSQDAPFLEVMRYLTGVALGVMLRHKGVLCLHASAVSVNEQALVFVGPSQTGKSTLSAAFHRRDFSLISEDIVAIDYLQWQSYVRSGYAGVRLYPDSLNHLYDPNSAAEALSVQSKFLYQFEDIPIQSYPIHALYFLAPRNSNLQNPQIVPIDNLSALLLLADHFYLHRFVGQQWLARDFPRLGQVIQQIPVYLLLRTNNLDDLDFTIDMLLDQNLVN